MRNLVLALVAVAVLCAAAAAFAQDKPAEPPKEQPKAEAAPAPAPVAKPEEKQAEPPAPVAKPEEKKPEPAPVAKPDTQVGAGEKKPEAAPAVPTTPPVPEKPVTAGEPAKPAEGEGVKATVEKKEEKVEGTQHIGGQTYYTEGRTWYSGSSVGYNNTTGINPDQPYYTMSLKLSPKVNITDEFLITGLFSISKEITNGNTNTAKRETQFGDTRIELVHTNLFKEKYSGIQFSGLLRFQLPTSKASQFATLRLATMADLGVGRSFFGDKLSVGYDFRFYKFFHKYTSPEYGPSAGGTWNGLDIRVVDGEYRNSGELNVDYQFAHVFAASYAFTEKLSAIVYFWIINGKTYEPTGGGPRGNRDSLDFNFELDYMVTKWFVVDAGFDTSQPQLMPDSTYPTDPFWRNTASNFTTVYFDLGFIL